MNIFSMVSLPSLRRTPQQTIRIDTNICKLASELGHTIKNTTQNFQDETIKSAAKKETAKLATCLTSLLDSYNGIDKISFITDVNEALISYNLTFRESLSHHNFDGSMRTHNYGRNWWIEPKEISDFIEKLSKVNNPEIYVQTLLKK